MLKRTQAEQGGYRPPRISKPKSERREQPLAAQRMSQASAPETASTRTLGLAWARSKQRCPGGYSGTGRDTRRRAREKEDRKGQLRGEEAERNEGCQGELAVDGNWCVVVLCIRTRQLTLYMSTLAGTRRLAADRTHGFLFTRLGPGVSSRLYTELFTRNPNPRSKIVKSCRKTPKQRFHVFCF